MRSVSFKRTKMVKVPAAEFEEYVGLIKALGRPWEPLPSEGPHKRVRRADDLYLYAERLEYLARPQRHFHFRLSFHPRINGLFWYYVRHPRVFVAHKMAIAEAHDYAAEQRIRRAQGKRERVLV